MVAEGTFARWSRILRRMDDLVGGVLKCERPNRPTTYYRIHDVDVRARTGTIEIASDWPAFFKNGEWQRYWGRGGENIVDACRIPVAYANPPKPHGGAIAKWTSEEAVLTLYAKGECPDELPF